MVAEWLASGRNAPSAGTPDLTVAEVMARYLDFVDEYYRCPDATPTDEPDKVKRALRPLRRLYGHIDAAIFGPLCLKALQQAMIGLGWCRKNVNQNVNIVRRMFKWAVEMATKG